MIVYGVQQMSQSDKYRHESKQDVDSDAETEAGDETEEEEDECEACGKVVKPVYEDEKGGWTIGNCLTCDAMCCRECLSKYATSEDICCVLCTPHK